MKRFILIGILFLLSFRISNAQESCVVEPVPDFKNNSSCNYLAYIGNDGFSSPCYQRYLIRRDDWIRNCLRYWDSQNNNQNQQNSQQPTIIEKIVIKEVIVTPTPFLKPTIIKTKPKLVKPSITPTSTPIPTPIIEQKQNRDQEKENRESKIYSNWIFSIFSRIIFSVKKLF